MESGNYIFEQNIKFNLRVKDAAWSNYWSRQYNQFKIIYAPNGEAPMKLYMTYEQSPAFVVAVGKEKGKSNTTLIAEGHKPVGGELVPSNAIVMPNMQNVSGAPWIPEP